MPSHTFTSNKLVSLGYDISGAPLGAHTAFKAAAAAVGFRSWVDGGSATLPLPDTHLQGEFASHADAERALLTALAIASAEVGQPINPSRWVLAGPDGQVTVMADKARQKLGIADAIAGFPGNALGFAGTTLGNLGTRR